MDQFIAEWLQMERSNHTRLLFQLKRELAAMRKDAPTPPGLPRTNDSSRPAISDRPSTDERSGERPVARTPIPTRQVMYR